MKILHIIIAVLLGGTVLTACKSDLEPEAPDFLPGEKFYANPDNYISGLNGVYDALQAGGMFGTAQLTLDALSDNSVTVNAQKADILNFENGSLTDNATSDIPTLFLAPYVLIQRASTLLYYLNKNGRKTIPQATFDDIKAEARVLRAIAYQRLVYLFGDVPLYKDGIIDAGIAKTIKRTPRNEVIDYILTELSDAATVLKTTPFGGVKGRVTKQVALSYYAQTMVYEARMGNRSWTDALTAVKDAKSVADGANQGLVTSAPAGSISAGLTYIKEDGKAYNAVFSEANKGNKELIFYVRYDVSLDKGPNISNDYSIAGGKLFFSAHAGLAKDFYTKAGLPITDPASGYDPSQPLFINRADWDPRLVANLVVPGSSYVKGANSVSTYNTFVDGKLQFPSVYLSTYFCPRKFTTCLAKVDVNTGSIGSLDIPAFRYAELLLLLAEAENQVNGPTTVAYNAMKEIRDRVGMANVALGLDKVAFNKEVIHERRVEFAFEGRRWFDLVTLGIADNVINHMPSEKGTEFEAPGEGWRKFVPGKSELLPIPKIETDRNKNLLPNNPGY